MPVTVVYAEGSKQIRRIIVSDVEVSPALVPGEAALDVPFKTYSEADHGQFAAYVESQIGAPTKDVRCVEVDLSGKVVAVYAADPDLDRPVLDQRHTLELHKDADIGDVKGHDGKFPRKVALSSTDFAPGADEVKAP